MILNAERHIIHSNSDEYVSDLNFVAREGNTEWFLNEQKTISYPVVDEFDSSQKLPNAKLREIIIVIGMNSVKEIEEVYSLMHPNSYMVVIETDPVFVGHVLRNKDLSVFLRPNISLIAYPVSGIMTYLNTIFNSVLILLLGNIKVYVTSFYRNFEMKRTLEIIDIISLTATSNRWGAGNSIDDCLEGSTQILQNLKYLPKSKDFRSLKGAFKNKPLIIVSAGPSLEKNIHLLHQIKNKAVIVSTESILERLLKEGIVPHFVTTMERVIQAYEFSYKGKIIPPEVTLVAPPVIKPMIYEEYRGNYFIPMRDGIREFYWWADLLEFGKDAFVMVGDSTAHLAFGLAIHTEANPVILVGQDLSFGDLGTKCHAGGTVYEEIGTNYQSDPMQEPTKHTEGYYGEIVTTNQLWLNFKKWFELYIGKYKKEILVINATEGGAKINGAIQMPLRKVIEQYCVEEISVLSIIEQCPCYDLDLKKIRDRLKKAKRELESIGKMAQTLNRKLEKIRITNESSQAELLNIHKQLKKSDELWKKVQENNLLFHNVQPMIVRTFHRLYQIEESLTIENIRNNIDIQKGFIESIIFVVASLTQNMGDSVLKLRDLQGGSEK